MSILEEKYDELTRYLMNKCYAWRADHSRYEDIVHSTMARLLEEEKRKGEFKDARTLWGRATNLVKEEIAQTFADRLPVSGVKFQAHYTATKALQAAGGDPRAAYGMQTGTSRVGRELIYAVSHGPSLYSPEYLADLDPEARPDVSSLTETDEDNIRVAMFDLTEQERQVVHLRMWMRMTNAQVGEEMGLSAERVRKIWQKALKTLKPLLTQSMTRFEDES
jgi:RNA polymerase sigma factor (sigma-70 family)